MNFLFPSTYNQTLPTLLPMEKQRSRRNTAAVWDCDSTLYDSFELESLQRQLDSALSARSLSMPHLSYDDRRRRAPRETKDPAPLPSKKHSMVPRSLLRLFRSVFNSRGGRQSSGDVWTRPWRVSRGDEQLKPGRKCNRTDRVFAMDDKRSGFLTTIPEEEAPEETSPAIGSFVRKTASERFGAKLISVYCGQDQQKKMQLGETWSQML